jgi:hypothetical protein
MRKHLITTLALAAVAAVAVAGIAVAAKPTIVQLGNLKLTLNGDFTPKKLPKSGKPAPIKLNVSGKIQTTDGTHPPAAKEFVVETDKNGSINVKGLPKCTSGKLQAQDTKNAEKICKKAIIGKGTTDAVVEFPEQAPFLAESDLLAFNGGVKGGKTTIFIHAYFSAPVSGAIVTTVKISKVKNGRYGTKSIATIPKIAGGFGSVDNFNLTFDRGFGNTPYLFAKCPDGRLQAKATGVFSDGRRLTGAFVRPCTPKG